MAGRWEENINGKKKKETDKKRMEGRKKQKNDKNTFIILTLK